MRTISSLTRIHKWWCYLDPECLQSVHNNIMESPGSNSSWCGQGGVILRWPHVRGLLSHNYTSRRYGLKVFHKCWIILIPGRQDSRLTISPANVRGYSLKMYFCLEQVILNNDYKIESLNLDWRSFRQQSVLVKAKAQVRVIEKYSSLFGGSKWKWGLIVNVGKDVCAFTDLSIRTLLVGPLNLDFKSPCTL